MTPLANAPRPQGSIFIHSSVFICCLGFGLSRTPRTELQISLKPHSILSIAFDLHYLNVLQVPLVGRVQEGASHTPPNSAVPPRTPASSTGTISHLAPVPWSSASLPPQPRILSAEGQPYRPPVPSSSCPLRLPPPSPNNFLLF